MGDLGEFIRQQREITKMSVRRLAELSDVSNPYLSQIERGLHEPSIRVVKAIAKALDISTESLLAQVGLLESEDRPDGRVPGATEAAIAGDPYLTDPQRQALLAVYRSYVAEARAAARAELHEDDDEEEETRGAPPAPARRNTKAKAESA